MRARRFVWIAVALTAVLALAGGPAASQATSARALALAGPCAPGAAYDPACDVDHDGDVDITDIQLTAGKWGQTGAWAGDNDHDHLGQIWTGSDNPLTIQGSFGAPDDAALVLSNSATNGDGLRVSSAEDDGVQVWSAGDPSAYWEPASKNGFEVNGAEGCGLYVGRADQTGVLVDSAGGNGFYVGETGANYDGVYVNSAGDDGLFVAKTGVATAYAGSASNSGVEIGNAEGYGVYVNSAGYSGVRVQSTQGSGVVAESADGYGFFVGWAGADGLFVCRTGSAGGCSSNTLDNGVEISKAAGDGVLVLEAGYNGVWAHTTRAGHDYGFYTPDRIFAGTTLLQSLSLVAQVGGVDALTPGDAVAAVGVADPLPDSPVHVAQVRLADGKSASVVGVVETRLELVQAGELTAVAEDGTPAEGSVPAPPELHSADGPAQPGDYVAITIYGAAQVKVDGSAAIEPGQRLTAAELPGHVRALRSKLLEDMIVSEGAPVIGVALAASQDGLVWVLVNPQ